MKMDVGLRLRKDDDEAELSGPSPASVAQRRLMQATRPCWCVLRLTGVSYVSALPQPDPATC